jgi:hypothetical protein
MNRKYRETYGVRSVGFISTETGGSMNTPKWVACFAGIVMSISFTSQGASQTIKSKETAGELHPQSKESNKETYQEAVEKRLNEFSKRLKALEVKGEKAGEKTRVKLRQASKELEDKMHDAEAQFAKLKASGAKSWNKAKSKMDAALKDLERSYERMAARFKDSSASGTQG